MLLGQNNNSSDTSSTWVFLLLAVFFVGYMWLTMPSPEEQAARMAEAERLAEQQAAQTAQQEAATAELNTLVASVQGDSVIPEALLQRYGAFAYSLTLPSARDSSRRG